MQNIDVKKAVGLSCIICYLKEKNSYSANPPEFEPTENVEFSDFMEIIYEQELRKIKIGAYDIDCGLSENEQTKSIEKFDRTYDEFMKDWE